VQALTSQPGAAPITPAAQCHLLLVDDDDSVRITLAEVLRGAGYHVEAVADVTEAMRLLDRPETSFDVIVADLRLQALDDGFAVIRRARSRDPDVVSIVLTGYVSTQTTIDALHEGVTNFLAKPCNIEELKLAIERGLERRRLVQEVRQSRQEAAAHAETEQARRELQAIFMQSPVGKFVLRGRDHVFELSNPANDRLTGNRALLGRPAREAFPELASQGVLELLDEVYLTGKTVQRTELPIRFDRDGTGQVEDYFFNVVYQPLLNAGGEITGVLGHVLDVTEQVRARQAIEAARRRFEILAKVGRALAASLEYEPLLQEIARSVVPDFADWCVVDVIEGAEPQDRHVAVVHVDPAKQPAAEEVQRRFGALDDAGNPLRHTLDTGESRWVAELTESMVLADTRSPAYAELVGRLQPRSLITVALETGQRRLGLMSFLLSESERRYTQDDLALAELIGGRAALAVQNAQNFRAILRAREDAREREREFETLADRSPNLITRVDRDLRLMYVSRAAELISGRPRDHYIGHTVDELAIPQSVAEAWAEAVRKAFDSGQPQELEFDYPTVSGTRFFRCQVVPEVDPNGRLQSVMSVMSDLTEHKRVEDWNRYLARAGTELAGSLSSESTLQRIAQLAVPVLADWCSVELALPEGGFRTVALAHVDPDKVRWAWDLQTRYPPDPEAPRGVPQVLRTGNSELYSEISPDILEEGARDAEHLRLIREMGIVSGMVVPLSVAGRVLGALTFIAAESNRRYGQDDLIRAEELARRAALALENARVYEAEQHARELAETVERQKDHFLSAAAHDLKTPLTSISGLVQLVKRRASGSEIVPASAIGGPLADVDVAVKRMSSLIDELLDIARQGTGQAIKLRLEEVDLGDVLRAVVEECQKSTRKHELSVNVSQPPVIASCDRSRIERVFSNIVGNAVKYSPSGGRVDVELRREEQQGGADGVQQEWAVLTVADQGIGIPPAELARIFERFQRASNAPDRIPGTGVGLAYVQEVIQQHGGTVTVQSQPGHGSTFMVRLPLMASGAEGRAS